MKKLNLVIILMLSMIMFSCGLGKQTEMLYEFQKENLSELNVDPNDLDFEVVDIEKTGELTGKDSMYYFKTELAKLWKSDPSKELIDTLTFNHIRQKIKDLIVSTEKNKKDWEDLSKLAKSNNDYDYIRYDSEANDAARNLVDFKSTLMQVDLIEEYYNKYAVSPDEVLSTKYTATYKMRNPLLNNILQTLTKVFYTNKEQSKFVDSSES